MGPSVSGFESAVVFGHADADGHLATEQTRGWLAERGGSVTPFVSSVTRSYRFWSILPQMDISGYDLVVFVDIAFKFRDPADSLNQLLSVADMHSDKEFIVVDHHPLVEPGCPRPNVVLHEVDDPYDCCLGEPDPEIMELAALCDGSPTKIGSTPILRRRALGLKRAAADLNGVAGARLLRLVRERRWDYFEALAEEPREIHLTTRGIRRRTNGPSPLLSMLGSLGA